MKKLLSILMLLVAIVTGAKADTYSHWALIDSNHNPRKTTSQTFTDGSVWTFSGKADGTASNDAGTTGSTTFYKWNGSDQEATSMTCTISNHGISGTVSKIIVYNYVGSTTSSVIEGTSVSISFGNESYGSAHMCGKNTGTGADKNATTISASKAITADQNIVITLSQDDKNGKYFAGVEITYSAGPSLSVTPATANPFTYVAGNGPSAAQEFTVNLSNSENAVSATLNSENYEMSKTSDGTYASTAIADLEDGNKVYVRLKAGLAKASAYDATLTFANDDVENNVVINLSGSVTGQTYTVTYDLNGGSGDAPTQDPVEAGTQITLPAAASKDFYTFNGWLCDADNVVYDAEALYPMTATPTTFTAQWTGPSYSSTLDFAANSATKPAIATLLASGNMISDITGEWETLTAGKEGYGGFKVKKNNASLKFLAQAGKHVTITLGSIASAVTLKKNGTTAGSISASTGNTKMAIVAFDAGEEDVLVELVTSSSSTVTLIKIAIEDALASTNVSVGETGFATIGLPYATTIPEGVTAYSVSAKSETAVTLSSAIGAGTTIPANKGFIIVANKGNYTFNQFANNTWQGDVENKLEATGASAKVAVAEGEFYYFAIINADKKKVGFKKCAENASLAANKAYLPGAGLNANSLSLSFEGETAINGIAESEANAEAPVKVVKNGQLFIGNYNVAGARIK